MFLCDFVTKTMVPLVYFHTKMSKTYFAFFLKINEPFLQKKTHKLTIDFWSTATCNCRSSLFWLFLHSFISAVFAATSAFSILTFSSRLNTKLNHTHKYTIKPFILTVKFIPRYLMFFIFWMYSIVFRNHIVDSHFLLSYSVFSTGLNFINKQRSNIKRIVPFGVDIRHLIFANH